MKIQDNKFTPNSRRIRIFLAEKALELPIEQLNASTNGQNCSEFTDSETFEVQPVLILEDGNRLTEVSAIWRYIEDLHPQPSLMGAEPLSRAQIEMWSQRIENKLFNFIYRTNARLMPAWGEICRNQAEDAFKLLESSLESRNFIAGEAISVADISAYVALEELEKEKIKPAYELQRLSKWKQAMKERSPVYAINHEVELCSA